MNDLHGLTARQFMEQFPLVLKDGANIEALGETIAAALEQRYRETAEAAIYPRIDALDEPVLDLLADELRTPLYRQDFLVSTKRRLVKETLLSARIAGTAGAVLRILNALYPGTELEEWFSYGGDPCTFRIYLDITHTDTDEPADAYSVDEMERMLRTVKRWAAHLQSVSYMIKRGLIIGRGIKSWTYALPFCGTIRCGTWWMSSTLGWSERRALTVRTAPEAFAVSPELSGTLPEAKTVGWSEKGIVRLSGTAEGFSDRLEYAGTVRSGTAAVASTLGWSELHSVEAEVRTEAHTAAPELTGTLPQETAAGFSVACGMIRAGGAADGFHAAPEFAGTFPTGTLPGESE